MKRNFAILETQANAYTSHTILKAKYAYCKRSKDWLTHRSSINRHSWLCNIESRKRRNCYLRSASINFLSCGLINLGISVRVRVLRLIVSDYCSLCLSAIWLSSLGDSSSLILSAIDLFIFGFLFNLNSLDLNLLRCTPTT